MWRGELRKRSFAQQPRRAQAAIGKPETVVADLCDELGVTRSTLYRYVGPEGELRPQGEQVLIASSR